MSGAHGAATSSRDRRAPGARPAAGDGLSASVSASAGRAALGAKHKNWRANYLRALNIYTPDMNPARARFAADAAVARQRGRGPSTPGPEPAVPAAAATESAVPSSRRRGILGHRSHADDGSSSARRPNHSSSSNNSNSNSSSAGSAVSRLLGRHHARGSGSASSGSPPDDRAGAYVFGMRSHLFRARRPASRADVLVVDRVSAPIEIPTSCTPTRTGTGTRSPLRGSKFRSPAASADCGGRPKSRPYPDQQQHQQQQPSAQLLSWEEPSVMLGDGGGWPLEAAKPSADPFFASNQFDSGDLPFVVPSRPIGLGIPEEDEYDDEYGDTEDDETLDLDRVEDSRDGDEDDDEGEDGDEDDIFKMELGSEDRGDDARPPPQLRKTSSGRYRRESLDAGGRRRGSSSSGRRGGRDGTGDGDAAGDFRALPESFVPPHQMVERDCFSLGLRDELKRRPLRT